MADDRDLADFCKVFSVDTRVKIVNLLKNHALCVGALTARLNVTQGAISQHLRILSSAGIVNAEKKGCFIHYSINQEVLRKKKCAIDLFLGTEKKSVLQKVKDKKSKGGKKCIMKKKAARSRKT